MKKTLVGIDNLEAYICQTTGKLYADSSVILTSGAKDELSKRGVAIVYGPKPDVYAHAGACPAGCTCAACTAAKSACADIENLLISVAAVLKKHYGVNDPEQLKTMSCQIVKTIKENV